MKTTRNEFGFNEWLEFAKHCNHEFNRSNGLCILNTKDNKYMSQAQFHAYGIDESARRTVELYCEAEGVPLPWKPDYDLSTIAGCEDAIKSCGYRINKVSVQIVPVIEIESERRLNYTKTQVVATLAHWQQAAQFAIDNHEH